MELQFLNVPEYSGHQSSRRQSRYLRVSSNKSNVAIPRKSKCSRVSSIKSINVPQELRTTSNPRGTSKCSRSSRTLTSSPIQFHLHRNAPELLSLEAFKAQRSMVVSLCRTLKYNEVSGLVGADILRRKVSVLDHGLHMMEIAVSERIVGQGDENKRAIGQLPSDRLRLDHHIRTRTSGAINEGVFTVVQPKRWSTCRA